MFEPHRRADNRRDKPKVQMLEPHSKMIIIVTNPRCTCFGHKDGLKISVTNI